MPKLSVFLAAAAFSFAFCSSSFADASMDLVSFSDSLVNVDGDTSGWSSGDTTVSLGTSMWDILSGNGKVTAYGGELTHRLTRGIGISNGEFDEIDGEEYLVVDFTMPYWINELEIRSLFNKDVEWEAGLDERARVDFYNGGSLVAAEELFGEEGDGTNGQKIVNFADPFAADKLIFFVPHIARESSEFALSKMKVTVTPEPVSSLLFLIGAGTLVAVRRRKARG